MATVTTLGSWDAFFGAVVAAAAALAGLLFVAVSINVRQILSYPTLPGRAAETLVLLVGVLVEAGIALVPAHGDHNRGIALLAVATVVWAITVVIQVRARKLEAGGGAAEVPSRLAVTQIPTLLMVAGAALVVTGSDAGLDLLAAGMLSAFVGTAVNAWVLLVEILR